MPFRDLKDFDGETLRNMTAAYDAVVARLGIKPDDPRTSRLATKIVALVKSGESDVGKLTERALVEVSI
jgi:hypothetical protein